MSPVDGLILADKPAGITSHDMVARARHALGRRRVGHAGTLDPFATGLLILLVGRATRVQRYLMALPKTYEVEVRFGATSTTGDTEGVVTETGVLPDFPLVLPTGELQQRPPAHSAVKVDGERSYARARRGEAVVLDERPIHVHEFTTVWQGGDRAGLRIVCGSGTYVRSLVADLGDAYCVELRRTAIGPFGVTGGWPGVGHVDVTDLYAGLRLIMPVVSLAGDEARAATHGRAVGVPDGGLRDPGPAGAAGAGGGADVPGTPRVWDHALLVDGEGPVAVAETREGGLLKPVVGFRA
ncbi:MAG TPA: tRNA pseudouridine(55) synthase TruB [Solirubrobacteraceae bacterium]|jgi:tRNA pseudouridine55 synthase|nr:tRNA pseudouridine(55) synthase TruB [Solirubrobacteraceae bacterium]